MLMRCWVLLLLPAVNAWHYNCTVGSFSSPVAAGGSNVGDTVVHGTTVSFSCTGGFASTAFPSGQDLSCTTGGTLNPTIVCDICPDTDVANPSWITLLGGYDIIDKCIVTSGALGANTTKTCGSCLAGQGTCSPNQPVKQSATLDCDCDLDLAPRIDMDVVTFWWLNLFISFPFRCPGQVTSWEFYASYTGRIYLGVWRLVNSGTQWELIGSNTMVASTTGQHTLIVATADLVSVKPGDVIGIYYPSSVTNKKGVVADTDTNTLCCGVTSDMLSDMLNYDIRANNIFVGTKVDNRTPDSNKRIAAVKATLDYTITFNYNKPSLDSCTCQEGCYYGHSMINWASLLSSPLTDCIWPDSQVLPIWMDTCTTLSACATGTCQADSPANTAYSFTCNGVNKTATIASFTSCSCILSVFG